jgi:KaiC/GvpD/RAD55 family RecA-like ATPase
MSNPYLDAALFYASKGWQVFPCKYKDKLPALKWRDEATTDKAKITAWFTQVTQFNIGIMTGKESGIVVLDVDKGHDGDESLFDLIAQNEAIPDTPESLTGGGGRHIIFAHPGFEIRNSASKLGPGLDIRGDGGYIVAPPSIHPSGKPYMWEVSSKPSIVPLAPMPEWLIRKLQDNSPAKETVAAGTIPGKIQAGSRNQTLASLAGSMRRRGMDSESIFAALQVENNKNCNPPLSEDEVLTIAKSYDRYQPTTPPAFESTETEYHEPKNAFEIHVEFMNLLDHLEGRSIHTWIPAIDKCLGGFERQTLTILAARPSMGKSTLAWQIARNIAANHQKAYFYSLEMSSTSLWAKSACGALGIRWRDVRNGEITTSQRDSIIWKSAELLELYGDNLLVDDYVNTSNTIYAGVARYKPDLIIVDHVRLVADRDEREDKRLGSITKILKDIAKEYNCAVLCLAQLNRKTEDREEKRPQLADLRDSGQIEENADVVLMMYREDYYETDKKPTKSPTEILVRKFRDDVLAQKIDLTFNTENQWFESGKESPEYAWQKQDR